MPTRINEDFFQKALRTANRNTGVKLSSLVARSVLLIALDHREEVNCFTVEIIEQSLDDATIGGLERRGYRSFIASYFRQRPNRKTASIKRRKENARQAKLDLDAAEYRKASRGH
jgi:hypothetical protein